MENKVYSAQCWTNLQFENERNWNDFLLLEMGGAVASWLVRSSPDQVVRVRALAGDIGLYSWARHFTLTVSLSTQVYNLVLANLMLGVTLRWTSIPSRGSRNTPSCLMLQKLDKFRPDGPFGSYADFTSLPYLTCWKDRTPCKFKGKWERITINEHCHYMIFDFDFQASSSCDGTVKIWKLEDQVCKSLIYT